MESNTLINAQSKGIIRYDYHKNQWIEIPPMKTARCSMCALADSKTIFVLGGYKDKTLKLVEKYDSLSGKWEEASPMIYERSMHSAILIRMQTEEKVMQNI